MNQCARVSKPLFNCLPTLRTYLQLLVRSPYRVLTVCRTLSKFDCNSNSNSIYEKNVEQRQRQRQHCNGNRPSIRNIANLFLFLSLSLPRSPSLFPKCTPTPRTVLSLLLVSLSFSLSFSVAVAVSVAQLTRPTRSSIVAPRSRWVCVSFIAPTCSITTRPRSTAPPLPASMAPVRSSRRQPAALRR